MSKSKNKKPKSARKHKRLSTEIVLRYLSQRQEPANTKTIAETLGRVGKEGRDETFEILEELRDQGKVQQLSKHRWAMKHAIIEHQGRVVGHVDGHGFVLTDETHEKVFLRSHEMREVLHNDIVRVRIVGRDRRQKLFGQITEIVERGNTVIVGRYFSESGLNFVVPDDQRIGQDIFILPEDVNGATTGQVVSVEITKHPSKHFQPVGKVVEVLGDYLAPGMEIQIAIRKHQLPHEWPESVSRQANTFADSVSKSDWHGRTDLRQIPLVTIDGEDARDFDDAVYAEAADGGGYRLVVAIADVSSYVAEGSPLDQEAWQRGTSVYFPSSVIPMLPEALSNGLCSLNPNVDRLCFVCDMQVDSSGEIERYHFYQAVMHSHARLTYSQVAKLIDGKPNESDIADDLQPQILNLKHVADLLGKRRRQPGAIEFEIPEPMIIFNDDRKIDRIIARQRNDAHKLIEECMLAANICASLLLDDSQLTGVYRVHEQPDGDKIEDLRVFLRQFKVLLKGAEVPGPKEFAQALTSIDDPQTLKIVSTAMLRSMKQARYGIDNLGHYALNFDSYTHFTSPIRRYSDLIVHRQIAKFLTDNEAQDSDDRARQIEMAAEQASTTERRAESASREVVQWLKCEFMSHRLGERMFGTVSSVTDFGLFVELEDFFVEGLVHITALGRDYYRYDADRRRLVGEHSGREYKAGDRLEVQISRVDMDQGRIDFELTDVRNEKHSRNRKFAKPYKKKTNSKSSAKSSRAKSKGRKR